MFLKNDGSCLPSETHRNHDYDELLHAQNNDYNMSSYITLQTIWKRIKIALFQKLNGNVKRCSFTIIDNLNQSHSWTVVCSRITKTIVSSSENCCWMVPCDKLISFSAGTASQNSFKILNGRKVNLENRENTIESEESILSQHHRGWKRHLEIWKFGGKRSELTPERAFRT